MWSSNLQILSPALRLEVKSIAAVGLHSCVNCIQLSGCISLLVSVSLCLPLWLLAPGSLDLSCYGTCFMCLRLCLLPVWLSTASGARLSKCLSSLVFLYLLPFWPRLVVSPFWSALSGSPGVSLCVSSFMCPPLWLMVAGCSDVFSLLSLGSHHFSLTICLPIHLSIIGLP